MPFAICADERTDRRSTTFSTKDIVLLEFVYDDKFRFIENKIKNCFDCKLNFVTIFVVVNLILHPFAFNDVYTICMAFYYEIVIYF